MFSAANILSQSSFGLSGFWGIPDKLSSPLYSYESNTSNFSNIKDWGIFFNYGAEFSESINSNLYSIAISKTIANHNLSARFSPGYQKEFLFSTGSIIVNDTTTQSLEAKYTYKEIFGLGYSYKFTERLSAGFTFRFFNQDFNQEIVKPVFGDTLYLVRETINEKVNFWKGDIGIDYILNDFFRIRAASINLLNFGDTPQTDEFIGFEMKQNVGAMFSASYLPAQYFNFHFLYETSNSFQVSATGNAGNYYYGVTAFHDTYQSPFIAGIVPAIGYKTNLFEILLSGVKYFSNRTAQQSFTEFQQTGIHSIVNNSYSFDKAVLAVTFTISSSAEQKVKLIDVEIVKDIYPTFFDAYLDLPFAYGVVVNLTDETLTIKPSVKIEGVHTENIQSPAVRVAPHDTLQIPYYVIIPESYSKDKAVLSYTDFYVTAGASEPDDHLQKAVLVNSVNSWDGKVSNLKYFIKKDLGFSMEYSKNILSKNKSFLDTVPSVLSVFYKAKLLFNDFVSRLVYTSDPRATAEYVQFPNQTIELKGGDCDDLSVAYSSLLESVGIQTALVDYKADGKIRHVNLLFNTELTPSQAVLITNNDSKYFVRENPEGKDQVWLPVETTSLTDFNTAWKLGVEKFNRDAIQQLGIATGKVEIIDIY